MPWVTFGVAVVWLVTWGLSRALPDLVAWDGLALDPEAVEPISLAAHWLLHESFVHMAWGVALLLMVGAVLEEAWGRPFFAGLLALMLLYTSGAHLVTAGEEARPLVGATAALTGLLGACIARQLWDGIRYTAVAWIGRPVHAELWVPVYALAGLWFLGEVAMQIADDGVGPTRGTSYAGQATGAMLGAALAYLMRARGLEQRWLKQTPAGAPDPALTEAELAMSHGDAAGGQAALRILSPAVQRAPDDTALVAALCRAAAAAREPDAAVPALLRLVGRRIAQGRASEAATLWADHAKALGRPQPEPRVALPLAEALGAARHGLEAVRLVRTLLDAPRLVTTGMALRLVVVARPVHAGLAIRAAQIALEGGDFAEEKRQRLEATVRELEVLRNERLDPQLDETPQREDRSIAISIDDDLRRPPTRAQAKAAKPPPPPEERDDSPFEMCAAVDLSAPDAEPVVGGAAAVGHGAGARPGAQKPAPRALAPAAAPEPQRPAAATSNASARPQRAAPAPSNTSARPARAPATSDPAARVGVEAAAAAPRFGDAKCIEVVPVAWQPGRLSLRQGDRPAAWLDLTRVQAVAAAAVHGIAQKAVVVIDLLMNWSTLDDEPLRVLRLRSDRFDPGALLPDAGSGLDAFRAAIDALVAQTGGTALPDAEHGRGRPFAIFRSLDTYEREVLKIDR